MMDTPDGDGGQAIAFRSLDEEIRRRRTFAIISHPDAGKTTLTEKLLLYGGAIHMAGSIKSRKATRYATSDWMEIERQRGISVTSSALQFDFDGFSINLLDTPGHKDFSEDTYRTLEAADSVIMLLDGAKGIEPQTLKLFEVARLRNLPIVTFINKVDRESLPPLTLLSEIEKNLSIRALPRNWPIGMGRTFRGVFDLVERKAHLYVAQDHGSARSEEEVTDISDSRFASTLSGIGIENEFWEEIDLLDSDIGLWDQEAFRKGHITPVFFGSALNNFGVELFLKAFLRLSPSPGPHMSDTGPINPETPQFSGFIFKIQANMDPQHRDRFAFLRVCSGQFRKGMTAKNVNTGQEVRLSKTLQFMGQRRESVDVAYPGDIIGLHDPGIFHIGDTLTEKGDFVYEGIPHFSPEFFVRVQIEDPLKRKHLRKGLLQIAEEGAIQIFTLDPEGERDVLVGAVGQLQFEVLKFRLEHEYKVRAKLEPMNYDRVRWITGPLDLISNLSSTLDTLLVFDREKSPVALFRNEWALRYVVEKYPSLGFHGTSPRTFRKNGRSR
ncbi:Peptide chain release factor 3 [Leptospirillum ferriphilum]|uniref:Peptide chain release factor 3 n=3 Tax=Leptospirillum TaxID=179 RepID=A0A094YNW8_9BACT|nr:Peptide chain release factor 3 [Leptospirillum ferriphilum]